MAKVNNHKHLSSEKTLTSADAVRVFLAGKVDAEHGAWRDKLFSRVAKDKPPYWVLEATAEEMFNSPHPDGVLPWPERHAFWLDGLLYVGP